MNYGGIGILPIATIAVVVGLMVLVAMVRYDLGPKGRLARGGQWLLATALGTGILAFTIKLGIIITIANAPEVMIEPLLTKPTPAPLETTRDPLFGLTASQRFVWQPLPEPEQSVGSPVAPKTPTTPYVWEALPEQAPAPADNPTTAEKVALGEQLFFDNNLSRDRTLSCSSCHDVPGGTGVDGRPTSTGINGQLGGRNAPTVWNAAFQEVLFWDGRAPSLEEQSKGPPVNPIEMGMESLAAVEERVRENPAYRKAFASAFGDDGPITIDRIAKAIAAYERTLITPDAPYDRFVRGDLDALSPAQMRGMALFQSLGCVLCHFGPNFSAASKFDNRAPMRAFPLYPTPFEQKYGLTRDTGAALPESGRGSWRVPSLRNVALTGPWLHNGSVTELKEVVRIMSSVQLGYTGRYLLWADKNKVMVKLNRPKLDDQSLDDIVAFLNALSSDRLVERVRLSQAQHKKGESHKVVALR